MHVAKKKEERFRQQSSMIKENNGPNRPQKDPKSAPFICHQGKTDWGYLSLCYCYCMKIGWNMVWKMSLGWSKNDEGVTFV